MSQGSGLQKSVGIGFESTYGVGVPPTVHNPLVDDSMKREIARIKSKGVIAGARTLRSTQWQPGNVKAGGDVQLELSSLSMGKWLRATFGGVVTAGAGPYTHTFTLGDLDDDAFSCQLGKPDSAGTVRPYTYVGSMVDSAEFAFDTDQDMTAGFTLISQNEWLHRTVADGVTNSTATVTSATAAFGNGDVGTPISGTGIPAASYIGVINSPTSIGLSSSPTTNTPVSATATASTLALVIGQAYTSPAYSAGIRPVSSLTATATIGGSAVSVKSGTIAVKNNLSDRRFSGSPLTKQPKEGTLREVSGKLTLEFEDNTQYRRYVNGDEFAVVISAAAGTQTHVVTMNCFYDGNTPQIKGTEVGQIELPYTCVGPTTDAGACTWVYTSSESTP